jgi:hypothetical protein
MKIAGWRSRPIGVYADERAGNAPAKHTPVVTRRPALARAGRTRGGPDRAKQALSLSTATACWTDDMDRPLWSQSCFNGSRSAIAEAIFSRSWSASWM